MNPFSWLSTPDGVFRFCEIVAILAGVLTVVALIGKDIAGRVVAERKAKEILALQKEVADARRGLARAIGDLDQRQVQYETAGSYSRNMRLACLVDALGRVSRDTGHKSVPVRVLHEESPRHLEENLARKIWLSLSIAGWHVAEPAVESLATPELQPEELSRLSDFKSSGLLLSPRANVTVVEGSAEDGLLKALRTCGALFEVTKTAFSSDTIFLIVGPVPPPPPDILK